LPPTKILFFKIRAEVHDAVPRFSSVPGAAAAVRFLVYTLLRDRERASPSILRDGTLPTLPRWAPTRL